MKSYLTDVYSKINFNKGESLKDTLPDLIRYWDFSKNEEGMEDISFGCRKKIYLTCSEGHEFEATPKTLRCGRWCKKCSEDNRQRTKTNESFVKELENSHGGQITPLEEYKNGNTKVKLQCNTCLNTFSIIPYDAIHKTCCPYCSGKRVSASDFEREFRKVHGDKYKLTANISGLDVIGDVIVTCTECDFSRKVSKYDIIKRALGCPNCIGMAKKNTNTFINEIQNMYNGRYVILGEYISALKGIETMCTKCGRIWHPRPNGLLTREAGCGICTASLGEKAVRSYLKERNIEHIEQYIFPDCKNVRPLRFDFAIFNNEGAMMCLVEYDGKQHFLKNASGRYSEEEIKKIAIRDGIKNEYCKNKELELLRIPYFEFDNIDEILDGFLSTFSLDGGVKDA